MPAANHKDKITLFTKYTKFLFSLAYFEFDSLENKIENRDDCMC